MRGPGAAAAAVLKLPNSQRGFALSLSGRGEVCAADPYRGAQAAVADAVRHLGCVGAPLLAITDGLNMASPRQPVEMRKIAEVVRGLAAALGALNVPVTGGNVSLYNESAAGPIPPTPMVGGIGIVADVGRVPCAHLRADDVVFVLGAPATTAVFSRFARRHTGVDGGAAPAVDLAAEQRLAACLVAQVSAGRVRAAKAVGLGGLAVAIAKLCRRGHCGAALQLPNWGRSDWALFGEYPAMAWVTCSSADAPALRLAAQAAAVPVHRAGVAGGDRLVIADVLDVAVGQLGGGSTRGGAR